MLQFHYHSLFTLAARAFSDIAPGGRGGIQLNKVLYGEAPLQGLTP